MKIQIFSAAAAAVAVVGTGIPSAVQASSDAGFDTHEIEFTSRVSATTGTPKSRMPMLKRAPKARFIKNVTRRDGVQGTIGENKGVENKSYDSTFKWPSTTSTVRLISSPKKGGQISSVTARPYLTAGKVFMKFGGISYVCSGSMIGKGIVITAAHCVSDWGKGKSGYATDVYFIPGAYKRSNSSTSGPVGRWKAKELIVPSCYKNGTCKNTSGGVISSNDIAILVLGGTKANLPSSKGVGYYGYGWNGFGFTTGSTFAGSKSMSQITQLGYPAAIGDTSTNRGGAMIRTDSAAMYYVPATGVKNFIWGSPQTGGSSGGPELVNFGRKPNFSSSAYAGLKSNPNIVMGVTSWGYVSRFYNVQGASWFGTNTEYPSGSYKDTSGRNWGGGNIGALMRFTCGKGYRNYQAAGWCR